MGVVSRLRIHDRFLQELRCENRLLDACVLIADIDAFPVVIHLAARRNLCDGIRHAQQQACFEEERQEIGIQRNRELVVAENFQAGQGFAVPGDVRAVAENMLRAVDLSADLLDLRTHHQQHGERVVPGCDLGAVGIVQIVAQ